MKDRQEFERLKALFAAATERPRAEWAAFLDEACSDAPDLRARLSSMLASHVEASRFLEEPAALASDRFMASFDQAGSLDDEPLAAGEVLDGKYRIEQRLGAGGMGIVYKAMHTGLQRALAIKVIRTLGTRDDATWRRFEVEAEALGRLKHPHIVEVTDFGVDQSRGLPYLAMELLEGETLADVLRRGAALPPAEALRVLDAVAAALDYAHSAGILHRDVKPANVFLSAQGEHVKLVDFGLALFVAGDASSGPPIGTPAYMAPELLRHQRPTTQSDVFSFGVLSREVLLGDATAQAAGEDAWRSDVRAALGAALSGNAEERPGSARAVINALRSRWSAAEVRNWRAVEIPRRVGLSAVMGIGLALVAPLAAEIPLLADLELKTLDARFALAPRLDPDPRILLVLIDDATLSANPGALTDKADEFGEVIGAVFAAGAAGVAIDLLLPEPWSRSKPFADAVIRNANRLTLAAFSTPGGEVVGPECVQGWTTVALGPGVASSLFGFVNTDQDLDGVIRRARLLYPDTAGGYRVSWSLRSASFLAGLPGVDPMRHQTVSEPSSNESSRYWIDQRIDSTRIERMSWKDVRRDAVERSQRFRDRLVLVGGAYAGSGDDVRVSGDIAIPGVVLHALASDTIVRGFPIQGVSGRTAAIMYALVAGIGALLVFFVDGTRWAAVALAALGFGSLVVSTLLFLAFQRIAPMVAPLGLLIIGTALASGARTQLRPFPQGYSVARLLRSRAGIVGRPVRSEEAA